MSRINDAVRSIDEIILKLSDADVDVRREAAAMAQYAFCGNPSAEKGNLLLEAVAARLELNVNGHVEPLEPDEYVRERCADSLRLASDRFNIAKYVTVLDRSSTIDPHVWVKDAAKEALGSIGIKTGKLSHDSYRSELPLPKSWSTRPLPASRELAPAAKEKQLRA
jgi:HEAT repeat protein